MKQGQTECGQPSAAATLSLPGPGHGNQATAARHVSLCQHPGSRSHSVLQTRPHQEAAGRAFSPRPRGDPRPQTSVCVCGETEQGGSGGTVSTWLWLPFVYQAAPLACKGSKGDWSRSGVCPELPTFSLHPRRPQWFIATHGHSFF